MSVLWQKPLLGNSFEMNFDSTFYTRKVYYVFAKMFTANKLLISIDKFGSRSISYILLYINFIFIYIQN